MATPKFKKLVRRSDQPIITAMVSKGRCFWYRTPLLAASQNTKNPLGALTTEVALGLISSLSSPFAAEAYSIGLTKSRLKPTEMIKAGNIPRLPRTRQDSL